MNYSSLTGFFGRHQRLLLFGLVVLVFGLGFGAHWLVSDPQRPAAVEGEAAGSTHPHADTAATTWTCSMHPQIRQPKPGKCPICGMDLIPVPAGQGEMTSLRQLSISPVARALMNIQTTPVERRYVTATVRMVGKVDYDETRLKYITAWVPGRLDRLFVDYTGVQVNTGDHMVSIYSPELYTAQEELITTLRSQRERRTPSRFLSDTIDLAESAREKLRLWGLTEEQIRAIEQQEKASDHLTIYSPISGIVIHKNKQEGDYVNVGERIYAVADLNQVWVKLDAYESDLPWLRYGQDVTFTTEAYPGEEFEGRIAFIDPVLNEKTRTVKVRVNVPNSEGKLKPEMFVRGTVDAEVAAGGRVIDEELAGKWISPMHPEIVKDEPGTCDICGMPLVRAESLGYVPSDRYAQTKPLVVPTSAVLLTGRRAVVYVEVPDREQPTYEGREIVLGPRAGDHYLVRSGLQEGELVVTNGNFKIDSALQIQAKPSMMTPEGGGGGGGHQHGDPKPIAGSGQQPDEPPMSIPAEFHAQIGALGEAYERVVGALQSGNLAGLRQAFSDFGTAVEQVDGELLQGHAQMQWNEFEMLLRNAAVEGSGVKERETAERIHQRLARTMQRVDSQFHGAHGGSDTHEPYRLEAPAEFRQHVAQIWDAYLALQKALAGDDLAKARAAGDQLQSAVAASDAAALTGPAAQVWSRERKNVQKIVLEMQSAESLHDLRESFSPLTAEMELLVHRFGVGEAGPVYRLYCSMAFENRGAHWLQKNDDPLNPYFGATMLRCHNSVEKIASGYTTNAEPGSDSRQEEHQHNGM